MFHSRAFHFSCSCTGISVLFEFALFWWLMKLRAFHTFIVNLTSLLQYVFSNSLICVWAQSCLNLLWTYKVWTVEPSLLCPWNFPDGNPGVSWHSPPPGDLSNSVTKLMSPPSPALARGFFTISTTWEAPFSNSLPILKFSSAQLLSCVQLFETSWTAERQASLSITNCWSLLKLIIHQVGDAIQPSHPP